MVRQCSLQLKRTCTIGHRPVSIVIGLTVTHVTQIVILTADGVDVAVVIIGARNVWNRILT